MKLVQELIEKLTEYAVLDGHIMFVKKFYHSVPYTLDKPTSSSGKYHQARDGADIGVNSVYDHTVEMLIAIYSLKESLEKQYNQKVYSSLMVAAAVHDGLKYGWKPGHWTMRNHAFLAYEQCKKIFEKGFRPSIMFDNGYEKKMFLDAVNFHNGPWSDGWSKMGYPAVIIHIVDMQSSRRVIRKMKKIKRRPKNA